MEAGTPMAILTARATTADTSGGLEMEQRHSPRRRVLKAANILFNDGRSTISCTIRNLSDNGALLRVESVVGVPESFVLVAAGGLTRTCTAVRKAATEIGVRFSDAADLRMAP